MLGNDIVDLQLAAQQSNWRRKGYLEKIFTESERQLIAAAKNQDQMVWLLWSMKEAVYKIVSRESIERFYNPKAFECTLIKSNRTAKGCVVYKEQFFSTESIIAKDSVHTIAFLGFRYDLKIHYFSDTKVYIDDFNKTKRNFQLKKLEDNVPAVINLKTGEAYKASVSHHGRFVAVVHFLEVVA